MESQQELEKVRAEGRTTGRREMALEVLNMLLAAAEEQNTEEADYDAMVAFLTKEAKGT